MQSTVRMILNSTTNRIKSNLNTRDINDYEYVLSLLHIYKGVFTYDFNTDEFILKMKKE